MKNYLLVLRKNIIERNETFNESTFNIVFVWANFVSFEKWHVIIKEKLLFVMKLLLTILICLQFTFSVSGQNINLDSTKTIDSKIYYKEKLYTGHYFQNKRNCSGLFVFQEGKILDGAMEGNIIFKNSKDSILGGGKYINGVKHDKWIDIEAYEGECSEPYYQISKGIYSSGKKIGEWTEGSSTGYYKDGFKEGTWKDFDMYETHKKKIKIIEGEYIHGKKEGEWTEWEIYNGAIKKSMMYKDGLLNGKYVSYFDKKEIEETGIYFNNKRIGTWQEYPYKAFYFTGNYENGLKDGIWLKYLGKNEKGELYSLIFYEEGKIKNEIDYKTYKNGTKEKINTLFDKYERADSLYTLKNDTLTETQKFTYSSDSKDYYTRKDIYYSYKNGTLFRKAIDVYDEKKTRISHSIFSLNKLDAKTIDNYKIENSQNLYNGSERTTYNEAGKPVLTSFISKHFYILKTIKYDYSPTGAITKEITEFKDGTKFITDDKGMATSKSIYIDNKLIKEIQYTYNEIGQATERTILYDH